MLVTLHLYHQLILILALSPPDLQGREEEKGPEDSRHPYGLDPRAG
jgi:hypothetical protein